MVPKREYLRLSAKIAGIQQCVVAFQCLLGDQVPMPCPALHVDSSIHVMVQGKKHLGLMDTGKYHVKAATWHW